MRQYRERPSQKQAGNAQRSSVFGAVLFRSHQCLQQRTNCQLQMGLCVRQPFGEPQILASLHIENSSDYDLALAGGDLVGDGSWDSLETTRKIQSLDPNKWQ